MNKSDIKNFIDNFNLDTVITDETLLFIDNNKNGIIEQYSLKQRSLNKLLSIIYKPDEPNSPDLTTGPFSSTYKGPNISDNSNDLSPFSATNSMMVGPSNNVFSSSNYPKIKPRVLHTNTPINEQFNDSPNSKYDTNPDHLKPPSFNYDL